MRRVASTVTLPLIAPTRRPASFTLAGGTQGRPTGGVVRPLVSPAAAGEVRAGPVWEQGVRCRVVDDTALGRTKNLVMLTLATVVRNLRVLAVFTAREADDARRAAAGHPPRMRRRRRPPTAA